MKAKRKRILFRQKPPELQEAVRPEAENEPPELEWIPQNMFYPWVYSQSWEDEMFEIILAGDSSVFDLPLEIRKDCHSLYAAEFRRVCYFAAERGEFLKKVREDIYCLPDGEEKADLVRYYLECERFVQINNLTLERYNDMDLQKVKIQTSGITTKVFLDNKPLCGVTSISVYMGNGEHPEVELTMIADVDMDFDVAAVQKATEVS